MNKINENRPGYKKTKVGWIPEGWAQRCLRDVTTIKSGTTPSRTKQNIYFSDKGTLWVKTMDLTNGVIEDTHEKITDQAVTDARCSIFPPKTVLVAMYGGFNQIGRTGILQRKAAVNQAISALVIKDNNALSYWYLLYWLNSKIRLWRRIAASSRKDPNITRDDVCSFPIAIPNLREQEYISEIITTWDDAIQAQEQLIAAKKKTKKALMQRLLTPPSQSAWKKIKLGKLFKERSEGNREALPLLAVTRERGIIPADETGRKDSSAEDKSKYKRVAPGDIAYNTMRMWQGVSALSDKEGIVSPAYTVCIPGKDIDGLFAAYLFKHLPVVHLFHRYSQGLVSDTLNLKFHNFAEIVVSIPEIPEQKKIAAVLATVDSELNSLQSLAEALKKQKRGLMQQLLTGAVRVKISKVTV